MILNGFLNSLEESLRGDRWYSMSHRLWPSLIILLKNILLNPSWKRLEKAFWFKTFEFFSSAGCQTSSRKVAAPMADPCNYDFHSNSHSNYCSFKSLERGSKFDVQTEMQIQSFTLSVVCRCYGTAMLLQPSNFQLQTVNFVRGSH